MNRKHMRRLQIIRQIANERNKKTRTALCGVTQSGFELSHSEWLSSWGSMRDWSSNPGYDDFKYLRAVGEKL
jgi:hypothetical protein